MGVGRESNHPYQAWTPETFARASRAELVAWLKWNDPNGEYTTGATYGPDDEPAASTEEYRALALAQWQGSQPVADEYEFEPGIALQDAIGRARARRESSSEGAASRPNSSLRKRKVMTDYTFDVKLFATIHVVATDEQTARRMLKEHVDGNEANFGAWPTGAPILGQVGIDGEADLVPEEEGEDE
jgi:hypothetical protein